MHLGAHRKIYIHRHRNCFCSDYGIERPYRQDGWTPVPKQVTKTDHKIITDKVEQVNRDIKDNYCELIHAQGEASPLYNWIIERFKNSKYTAVELSDNDLLECNIDKGFTISSRQLQKCLPFSCKSNHTRKQI